MYTVSVYYTDGCLMMDGEIFTSRAEAERHKAEMLNQMDELEKMIVASIDVYDIMRG